MTRSFVGRPRSKYLVRFTNWLLRKFDCGHSDCYRHLRSAPRWMYRWRPLRNGHGLSGDDVLMTVFTYTYNEAA